MKNIIIAFAVCATLIAAWHLSPLKTPEIIPLDEPPAEMMCDE